MCNHNLTYRLTVVLCIAVVGLCGGCQTTPSEEHGVRATNSTIQPPIPPPPPLQGIRVNGTDQNPTYGYYTPEGDVKCCWETIEEAQAAADAYGRNAK